MYDKLVESVKPSTLFNKMLDDAYTSPYTFEIPAVDLYRGKEEHVNLSFRSNQSPVTSFIQPVIAAKEGVHVHLTAHTTLGGSFTPQRRFPPPREKIPIS